MNKTMKTISMGAAIFAATATASNVSQVSDRSRFV